MRSESPATLDLVLDTREASALVGPATVLPTAEGRLMLAYTLVPDDPAAAFIAVAHSDDGGRTWIQPRRAVSASVDSKPSLLELPSGRILLSVGALVHHSDDSGRTWSAPVRIDGLQNAPATNAGNDRLVRLRSGRVMLPAFETGVGCVAWFSDDGGATWKRGDGAVHAGDGVACAPPVVAELPDGTVAMFVRANTPAPVIHTAHSRDGGETWSMFSDWGPTALLAPFAARRVPRRNEVVLIWTNHSIPAALSSCFTSDGRFWEAIRQIEEQQAWPAPNQFVDPSLVFADDQAHLTYVERFPSAETTRLVYRRMPVAWFYEREARRKPIYDIEAIIREFAAGRSLHDPRAAAMIRAPFNPVKSPV